MPMYRQRDVEFRQAIEETAADIASWSGLPGIQIGWYYSEQGDAIPPRAFEKIYEEVPFGPTT